jgi:hypothetical protein
MTKAQIDPLLRLANGALDDPDQWAGKAAVTDYRHAATLGHCC